MADQKGFPDKPAKPGAVTIYTIRGRDGVPKMVRPEEFPPLPAPAHRFDYKDLFTAGQMWEYIEVERERVAGSAPALAPLNPEANRAAFETWVQREYPGGLSKGERHIAHDGWDAGLMHGRSTAFVGAQPDAWQMRRYYAGDDAGWGMWKECSAEEAQKWKGRSDIQVRPLYAHPPA